jgi:hypothetical protein
MVSVNESGDRLACPECGSQDLVPIVYGLPGPDLSKAAQRGEVVLGGRVLGAQNRACRACGASFRLEEARIQSAPEEGNHEEGVPKLKQRRNPPPRKQYRNLKPTLAGPDDEIYKIGFVVGGKRLGGKKPKTEDKQ